MRYLTCSLFIEGRSDGLFLAEVLTRQLRGLVFGLADFGRVTPEPCRTVADHAQLDADIVEVAQYTDLLLVHHDRRESSKIEALRARVGARIPGNSRLVGVVPKVETEAWCLADPGAFSRIAGSGLARLPRRAADVEKIADPKAELAKVLAGRRLDDALQLLGANISLDRLAEVPAYQTFLHDLTTALKELNFR